MLSAVQLRIGQTRNFTYGYAAMNTINVCLRAGTAIVINRGPNDTVFVKSGSRRVRHVRILNLRLGQTVIVKSVR